jgi:hypothetical protein
MCCGATLPKLLPRHKLPAVVRAGFFREAFRESLRPDVNPLVFFPVKSHHILRMKLLLNFPHRPLLLLILMLVAGCQTASGPKVNVIAGRGFRTFAIGEVGGLRGVNRHLELLRGVTDDITAELKGKGYQPAAPAQADFIVEPVWDILSGGVVALQGEFVGDRTITAVSDVELAAVARTRATGEVVWKHSVWLRATRQQATPLVRHEIVRELFTPFPVADGVR